MSDLVEELKPYFKITCVKCGSENVVISHEEGAYYGELTGSDPDEVSGGCNNCKQNDFRFSI